MGTHQGDIVAEVETDGQQQRIVGDVLLLATGRIANTDIMQVARAGIAVDPEGQVHTNQYRQTSVAGIWALGDMTGPHHLKHAANLDARICAYNVLHPQAQRPVQDYAMPHAIFAAPQVASVGLTESQAKAKRLPYMVGRHAYSDVAYGWAIEETEGFVKILAHQETRQVLGAHILGPHASILLQPLVNAMRFGETIDQLAHDTIYIHPALPEVIENALLKM